jgi:hypothetical protein
MPATRCKRDSSRYRAIYLTTISCVLQRDLGWPTVLFPKLDARPHPQLGGDPCQYGVAEKGAGAGRDRGGARRLSRLMREPSMWRGRTR